MDNLFFARATMSLTLGFHIIFACIGMVMPFLMAISHYLWLKRGEDVYYRLTRAWLRGVAIFFTIGAVSGTALSFELGLLWPGFMKFAGPIIGMPFSWEGTAFFVEAICLGLFLYGWKKINKWVHWLAGLMVGVSGVLSGIFVVCANAWMNAPAGFTIVNGQVISIDPFKAMFNPAWLSQTSHMIIAAFEATAFGVAGLHAILLLNKKNFEIHRKAISIALTVGAVFALLQLVSGDYSAKDVAKRQPIKLAAMEGLFESEKGAGLTIGGIPFESSGETKFGIKMPYVLSFLAYGDFHAEVKGLNSFIKENKPIPPVAVTHIAFQIMVGCGSLLAIASLLFLAFRFKFKKKLYDKRFLKFIALCTPLGFIAVEAGWVVTEVGRQPWIIYNLLKVKDSVSPVPGQVFHFIVFLLIYLILLTAAFWLMKRQIKMLHLKEEKINPSGGWK